LPEKTFQIADADPGIRERLARIINAGFVTTDSGDGVSKPSDERALNVPHVVVTCAAGALIPTAEALDALVPDAHVDPSLYRGPAGWCGVVIVWWDA
jgi:hypothetical protein